MYSIPHSLDDKMYSIPHKMYSIPHNKVFNIITNQLIIKNV